uniref:Uncharacterized protein n=1 Tax=Glossina austeni TaxID=7395 RepID=A0A1A9VGM2_GLOAU
MSLAACIPSSFRLRSIKRLLAAAALSSADCAQPIVRIASTQNVLKKFLYLPIIKIKSYFPYMESDPYKKNHDIVMETFTTVSMKKERSEKFVKLFPKVIVLKLRKHDKAGAALTERLPSNTLCASGA